MDAPHEFLDDLEQRFHEVLGAYLEFADAGCAPDRDEFLGHYPELASKLQAFFTSQDQVRTMAGTPAAAPIDEQQTLGDYQLHKRIGRGGEGEVFKAWHKGLQNWVALKTIKTGPSVSPAEVRRFRVGIEAAAKLDHRHIAPIYDVREHRGLPYFSMKLFEAGSVETNLARFPQDLRAAATLMAGVARAIHYAHQHGILHLDLKPANILLDEKGEPSVADFGLAKRVRVEPASAKSVFGPPEGGQARPAVSSVVARSGDRATMAGSSVGPPKADGSGIPGPPPPVDRQSEIGVPQEVGARPSPMGMTPKNDSRSAPPTVTLTAPPHDPTRVDAFRGTIGYAPVEPPSTAADVYGLGATLYKLLTGRKTSEERDLAKYIQWFRACEIEPPRNLNPKVDARLEAICLKCLRQKPQERYASAEALAEDLDRWLKGEPPQAWPMPWWLRAWRAVRSRLLLIVATSAIAFAAAAVFFVFYYFDPDRIPDGLLREANRQRVTLIGPTGPPKWSRWNLGEATAMVAPEADEPFSYTSFDKGRLELLRGAPQRGFRFAAEVRHDSVVNGGGAVGIYLGYVARRTDDDIKRYWCDITFADRGVLARAYPGPDKRQKYGVCELSLQRKAGPKAYEKKPTQARTVFLSIEEARTRVVWRHLSVEVRPEKVNVFWEGEPLPELSRAELRQLCQSFVVGNKVLAPEFEFAPDGALGLYVSQGQASFRHVTIEPLK
jgi:serine/threonine protein kinase